MPREKLVIATHNRGKLVELRQLLEPVGFELSSAADHLVPEPEETEDSFAGNAALKAEHCLRHTGIASLADDSGLCVEALDNAPGVYSARWAGPDKDFPMAMRRIRSELEARGVNPTGARAFFVCQLALHRPKKKPISVAGQVYGSLVFPPRGNHGFGYDPIFLPDGHALSFGEMRPDIKESISHRADAFKKLLTALSAI
jgi:XTP/dITP diphosphohydrolase